MSRPIWKGHISFGLVNVPVILNSAERRADLSFRMIDSRNSARICYERVNEETGEEVPWDKIVKGYEYEDGNYVLLGEKGYVLLREAIADSGKAGIAKVVIRGRQHLSALMAQGKALVLELLRFDQELIDLS